MKTGTMDPDQRPTFTLGVVVAAITTPLWFVVVASTSLTNEPFMIALTALSGAVALLGCLLALQWHWRRFGTGLAVGAPIAWLIQIVILVWLILGATS